MSNKSVLNIGNLTVDSIHGDNNAIAIGDNSDDAVSLYRVNALTAIGDLDIVGGVVGSLCEAYRSITNYDGNSHRINLLFDINNKYISICLHRSRRIIC